MSIFSVNKVDYEYRSRYQTVKALSDISYDFESGKFYAIVGRSGSGKTTLLSLLAGLDLPTGGEIVFDGKATKDIDRSELRRKEISVIYQNFNLFPLLTALENVMYPMQLNKMPKKEAEDRAKELLLSVGLGEKIFKQFPKMMSGGEQQRVAVARALATDAKVILADEPTGNLDTENGTKVIGILKALAHEKGKCVIVITHDEDIAAGADEVLRISDGKRV
ncbi:MAG: ABC transporter ATP-binding protein [Clostridia bacterium]|nr:ABC transporter ATP-binding protein [Clostridia bacterium]